jgi:hypothetical protein
MHNAMILALLEQIEELKDKVKAQDEKIKKLEGTNQRFREGIGKTYRAYVSACQECGYEVVNLDNYGFDTDNGDQCFYCSAFVCTKCVTTDVIDICALCPYWTCERCESRYHPETKLNPETGNHIKCPG